MYNLKVTKNFKKSLKRIKKRGYDLKKLNDVIDTLKKGQKLSRKYNDHELTGNYKGYRDCHIEPDWLLIYKIESDLLMLTLVYTGTHSDLNI